MPNLLLTHGDAQNAGGFETIWTEFKSAAVYVSTARSRSPYYRRALQVLENHPDRRRTVSIGDFVNDWEVLHPPAGRGHPRAHDNAMVLRSKLGAWTVLHLSDLGETGQRTLMQNHADLRADIVIAGMPEQNEPLAAELLEEIRPKVIILGTTRYPYRAEGGPELRARLEASGAAVFYTTDSDAITICLDDDSCTISAMSGKSLELSRPPGGG
mgnify:FL=1